MVKYILTLKSEGTNTLEDLSTNLGVDKGEIIRRALMLFKASVHADKTLLISGSVITNVISR